MIEIKLLTFGQAMVKAAECREMATHVHTDVDWVMLRHMAETWERIAKDLKSSDSGS